MTQQVSNLTTLSDIEQTATGVLPDNVVTMLKGGYNDETTYNRTQQVLESVALRPRRLTGITEVDYSTTLLGTKISIPILPSPAAPHFSCHPDAELAVTRAAEGAGTIQVVPHVGHCSHEENARATKGPLWAQLFFFRDRGRMRELLQGLEELGYRALVMTVDTPSLKARREQELLIQTPDPHTADPASASSSEITAANVLEDEVYVKMGENDPTQSWEYVDWIRSNTSLPVLVKGILRSDMAQRATEHGATGIIVSSHGARLFDGQLTSIEALPHIAEAVGSRAEVLLDGGIRTGSDVVKALAFGARAVLLGRPIFYGLAASGEAGVRRTLDVLREELARAMMVMGRASLEEIVRSDVTLLQQAPVHRL